MLSHDRLLRRYDLMNNREQRRTRDMISILIVDDHHFFREGLLKSLVLEDDMKVVAEAKDGNDALNKARETQPDIVLLDVNLPQINGLQVARQLKTDRANVNVIVLTAYHDSEQVIHALKSGAAAYCPKDILPDDLIDIIRDVHAGFYVVNDQRMDERELELWINQNVEAIAGPHAIDPEEHFLPLSPREMQILEFVVKGLSNKEIAQVLRISHQTVKNHMTSILKKLNVQDRTQAAVTALRHGWVRMQDTTFGDNTAGKP